MEMINLEKILRKEITEYLRPDFPATRLETVVDRYFLIAEEKSAILKAMKEACEKCIDLCSETSLLRKESILKVKKLIK